MKQKKVSVGLLLGALALFSGIGCSARIDRRGKLPDSDQVQHIKPGAQRKEDVLRLIGSPSSIAAFDANTWIYDFTLTETVSFWTPEEKKQKVYLIRFDAEGKVLEIHEEDGHGHDIAPVRRATPTPGNDQTFLQSIFGNFGKKAKKIKEGSTQESD